MSRGRRALRWLRIEDRSGKLSLTTVAFVFALVCIALGKTFSLTELGAFVTAVTMHRHRQGTDLEAAEAQVQIAPEPQP